MTFDPEVANSGGFFKDPKTKLDLIGSEKRVIQCSIDDNGKFIWPQVQFSDGSVGKIVYKLWTAEEKAIYKQYRANGKQRIKLAHVKQEVKQVSTEQTVTHSQVEEYKEPAFGSVTSGSTLAYIRNCDVHLGVWIWDKVLYDLLSVKGSNSYMPIPRSLIPKEDRERLKIC